MLDKAGLERALQPLVEPACDSADQTVAKAGVVLAALSGCLVEPMEADDHTALDELARLAGAICQHRAGWHDAR